MTKKRDPIIRNSPQQGDLNLNGNIFGGWIQAQMDEAGGITASRIAKGRVATVAINAMKFMRPVHLGDVISCYTELVKIGNTSLTVKVEVTAMRASEIDEDVLHEVKVTEAVYIFVALDDDLKPRKVLKDKG